MGAITGLDVWFGGFNVTHYTHGIKALVMNCKLKQHWPYFVVNDNNAGHRAGVTIPILFGAPYINDAMAIPASLSNRKKLDLTVDIANNSGLDNLELDIAEVVLPDAHPAGCIKQEELAVANKGVGEHDEWLQTNWDLIKLLLYSPTVPIGSAYTSTIERAGMEIDDFAFGYKNVPWEILHGELMDELDGRVGLENHVHSDPAAGDTHDATDLEHWIKYYGQLDFFYEKDLKWRAPLSGASTAKLKYTLGNTDAWSYVTACYVPASKL
jgi:hypothetical protein